jgi:hypothetical protein
VYVAYAAVNLHDILRRNPEQFAAGRLEFWRGFGKTGAWARSKIMRMSMLHAISTMSPALEAAGGDAARGGAAGGGDDDGL